MDIYIPVAWTYILTFICGTITGAVVFFLIAFRVARDR